MKRLAQLINGITQHGKSYFAKNKVIPKIAEIKPVIIFDRKGEYGGPNAKDTPKKWPFYNSIDSFFQGIWDNDFSIYGVHVILCRSDFDYTAGIGFFRDLEKPVHLVLDEAHDIFLASDFKRAKQPLIQLCRYGAHDGLGLTLISQRTHDIPPNARTQFTTVVTFKQTYKEDVNTLSKFGMDDPEKVLELKPKQYLIAGEIPFYLK